MSTMQVSTDQSTAERDQAREQVRERFRKRVERIKTTCRIEDVAARYGEVRACYAHLMCD